MANVSSINKNSNSSISKDIFNTKSSVNNDPNFVGPIKPSTQTEQFELMKSADNTSNQKTQIYNINQLHDKLITDEANFDDENKSKLEKAESSIEILKGVKDARKNQLEDQKKQKEELEKEIEKKLEEIKKQFSQFPEYQSKMPKDADDEIPSWMKFNDNAALQEYITLKEQYEQTKLDILKTESEIKTIDTTIQNIQYNEITLSSEYQSFENFFNYQFEQYEKLETLKGDTKDILNQMRKNKYVDSSGKELYIPEDENEPIPEWIINRLKLSDDPTLKKYVENKQQMDEIINDKNMKIDLESFKELIYLRAENMNEEQAIMPVENIYNSPTTNQLGQPITMSTKDLELKYLTTDEYKMFLFTQLYCGETAAASYYYSIVGDINMRKGKEEAEKAIAKLDVNDKEQMKANINNFLNTTSEGFEYGMKSFFDGLCNTIAADGEMSADDWAKMYYYQYLVEHSDLYDDLFNISSTIGNMAPTIALSTIISLAGAPEGAAPLIASSLMGISAGGNAREQALQMGADQFTSIMYGFFIGASEVLGEYLGNIPGISQSASFALADILKEGGEEFVQSYVEGFCQTILLGQEFNLDELNTEAINAFLMGCITSALLTGGQEIITYTLNGVTYTLDTETALDELLQNIDTTESNSTIQLNTIQDTYKYTDSNGIEQEISGDKLKRIITSKNELQTFLQGIDQKDIETMTMVPAVIEYYYNNEEMMTQNQTTNLNEIINHMPETHTSIDFTFSNDDKIQQHPSISYIQDGNVFEAYYSTLKSQKRSDRTQELQAIHELYDYIMKNDIIVSKSLMDRISTLNNMYYESTIMITNFDETKLTEPILFENEMDVAIYFGDIKQYLYKRLKQEASSSNDPNLKTAFQQICTDERTLYTPGLKPTQRTNYPRRASCNYDINAIIEVMQNFDLITDKDMKVISQYNRIQDQIQTLTEEEQAMVYIYTAWAGPWITAYNRQTKTNYNGTPIDGTDTQDIQEYLNRCVNLYNSTYGTAIPYFTIDEYIGTMDKLINNSTINQDIVVYRGTEGLYYDNKEINITDMKPGTIFNDKGYASTSAVQSASHNHSIVLEIEVPAGTHAAYIETNTAVADYGQQEILLGRDTQYEITGYPYQSPDNPRTIIVPVRVVDSQVSSINKTAGPIDISNQYAELFGVKNGTDINFVLVSMDTDGILYQYEETVKEIDELGLYDGYIAIPEHDAQHVKNVLLFSMYMGEELGLTEEQMNLLVEAAKFHDIGLVNEDGKNHAAKSAEKAYKYLVESGKFSEKEISKIQAMIEYHEVNKNIENSEIYNICAKYNITDPNEIAEIQQIGNILKDADAVDRVRFPGNLDQRYLRNEVANEIVLAAYELREDQAATEIERLLNSNEISDADKQEIFTLVNSGKYPNYIILFASKNRYYYYPYGSITDYCNHLITNKKLR